VAGPNVDLGFLSELKGKNERISSKDLVAAVSHAIDKGLLKPGDRVPSLPKGPERLSPKKIPRAATKVRTPLVHNQKQSPQPNSRGKNTSRQWLSACFFNLLHSSHQEI
jgi:hypothetical protein